MNLKKLLSTLSALAIVLPVTAQDLAAKKEALNIISDFAEKICKSAPLDGDTQRTELSGEAKVELSNLLKKVADFGIEGAAKYGTEQYRGVLQRDLAITIKQAQDCRLTVFKDLKDTLIVATPDVVPEQTVKDDCMPPYVWRLAVPSDHVCVTEESRKMVELENQRAAERRQADGTGAFGADTCVSGYVWREAFDGDTYCVLPQRRDDVRNENAVALQRVKR